MILVPSLPLAGSRAKGSFLTNSLATGSRGDVLEERRHSRVRSKACLQVTNGSDLRERNVWLASEEIERYCRKGG